MGLDQHSDLLTGKREAGLRKANCRAIYVEMALHAGTWDSVEIARRCEAGLPVGTELPDRLMRRLLKDQVPTFNAKLIDQGLPGAKVFRWTHHPLFYLLDRNVLASKMDQAIFYALDSLTGIIRQSFWPAKATGDEPWSATVPPTLDTARIQAAFDEGWLDSLSSLDLLVACIALALKAQSLDDDRLSFGITERSQKTFVSTLRTCPHLLAGWRELAKLMHELVWEPGSKHVADSGGLGNAIDSIQFSLERDVHLKAQYSWIWGRLLDDASLSMHRPRQSAAVPLPPLASTRS